ALLEGSGVGPGSWRQAMPLAARDGTLAKRFTTSPAAGRLRAKTGSLVGVTALSGWSDGERNGRLVFSLLANGLASEASGRALEDRLGTAVSLYPQAPDPPAPAPWRATRRSCRCSRS